MTPTAMACDLAREALEPGTRWRHKKRGSTYEIVGIGKMQAENWRDLTRDGVLLDGEEIGDPVDMREVAVYRALPDGQLWARPVSEFLDGRFEPLPRTAYDAIGAGVKALSWSSSMSHGGSVLVGRDPNGIEVARIYYDANREDVASPRIVAEQAAAQTNFERRVLSCISTHTAAGDRTRLDLGNLLAIIHRDGGHYELEHGTAKAVEEAHRIVGELLDHTAVGAGPVGEAVAPYGWHSDVMGFTRNADTAAAWRAQSLTVAALYTRPVEEPDEVERLRAMVDDRDAEIAWLRSDRDRAEAALAETRAALSRLLNAQAPFKVKRGESRLDASDRWQKERADAAQAARAVLTGDAQEAGK